jgi:hypothetical protein
MSLISMILLASSVVPLLSAGQPMPPLKGEYLTGRTAQLPDAASGKVTLVALGFTYQSRFPVEAWISRFRLDFGENSQITFYEVPMIGGMARIGKWFIDSGMRKGTPAKDQENVITVYGGVDSWKQRMGYQAPDVAYLVLLDKHGKVRWHYSGSFDENAYRELNAQVTALLREL